MKLKSSSFGLLVILASLVAIGPLSTDMYLPAQPTIKSELGASLNQVQLTLSIFLLGISIALPFWGPLADRFGRRPALLSGIGLYIIGSIGCALSSNIEGLIFFRFIQAFGACVGPTLGRTMVRDIFGAGQDAKAFANMAVIMSIGPALAPTIGGFLVEQFNWHLIFIVLACFSGIAALFYSYFIGETLKPEFKQSIKISLIISNYKNLLADRVFVGYAFIVGGIMSGLYAFLSVAPFIFIEFFSLSPQQFGYYFLCMVLGYTVGSLSSAVLTGKLSSIRLILVGITSALMGAVLMLILSLAEFYYPISVIVPIMLFSCGAAFVLPNCGALSLRQYPHMAGTASSLTGMFQNILGALAGILVAWLHQGNATVLAIYLLAIASFTLFAFYFILTKEERQSHELDISVSK